MTDEAQGLPRDITPEEALARALEREAEGAR